MWPLKKKRQPTPKKGVTSPKPLRKKIKNRRLILEEAAAPPSAKS